MHTISPPSVLIALIVVCRVAQVSFAASAPAPSPCPGLDGSSDTDATGSSYRIQCNAQYPGNDLPAVHTDTFEECLKECGTYVPGGSAEVDDYASCIGVSWGAGNSGGNYYLNYQITTIDNNDVGFLSDYFVNYTLPVSAVADLGSSPSTTSAPAMTSTEAAPSIVPPTPIANGGSDTPVAMDSVAATSSAQYTYSQ